MTREAWTTVTGRTVILWTPPMFDHAYDLAPISEALTNGVQVEVLSRHVPENSRPEMDEWVFQYTVRITNRSSQTVQLLSRHWIISDALDHVEEVRGPGVVGEQPILKPGESFK